MNYVHDVFFYFQMNQESLSVLHDVYNYLLRLMERVKQYAGTV